MKRIIFLFCTIYSTFCYGQKELFQSFNIQSSLVVEGKVIASSSNFRANGDIVTNYIVETTQTLKGDTNTHITVQVLGGQVDGHFQIVSHRTKLKNGDFGLFFLKKNSNNSNYFFKEKDFFINYDKLDRQDIIELNKSILEIFPDFEVITHSENPYKPNNAENGVITSVLPQEISAGIGSDLTISGSGFGNQQGTVGFLTPDDGGRSYTHTYYNIKSWTDTKIIVTVPSDAGSGRIKLKLPNQTTILAPLQTSINIPYARFNLTSTAYGDSLSIPLRHIGAMPNGINPPTSAHLTNGAYYFKMGPNFYNNESARTIFLKYLDQWTCKTGINFVYDGVLTLEDEVSGLLNEVKFSNFDENGYGGAAFTSISGLYTCPSSTSNPDPETITAIVTEIDFMYDSEINWGYETVSSNEFDFSFTTAHEIGHAVFFGHVIDINSLMHYAGGNGDRNLEEISEPFISAGITGVSESISQYLCGDPITFSSCFTLSKKRTQIKNDISVTNSGSIIRVKTSSIGKIKHIYVYDLSGKVILEIPLKSSLSDYSFDLSPSGNQMYLLKVLFSDEIVYTTKLIV